MFKDISYDSILQRMLDRVSPQIDKREGSIIYDALAPAAMELMAMYIELKRVLDESFADTASREYLIKRAAERGLSPKVASFAMLQGEFNLDVPIGARFSQKDLNYTVVEKIPNGGFKFKLQCETIGTIGNKNFGDLIPIDYIQGLTKATLTELLVPGEDVEDTEVFRTRYFNSFDAQAFGGNIADYIEKTTAISGVGACKVYPIWQGGGTVKLVILSSEFEKPNEELIRLVQNKIDPLTGKGTGKGLAPVGHVVTVFGATEKPINIKTKFTFEPEYNFSTLKTIIDETIKEYFKELRQSWQNEEFLTIRISQIETRLLKLNGIIDIERTTLNDIAENSILSGEEIPVLGVVSENV